MRLLLTTIRNALTKRSKLVTLFLCLLGLTVMIILTPGEERQTPPLATSSATEVSTVVELPLVGEIDASRFSLPVLAVVLGLVDGLNPCAMWVLVYLISLILSLRDRRKIWLLVGTFVAASGILYFLFMTAWLNAFLLLGYIRYLTLVVGFFALWVGVTDLYETIRQRGADEACQVGDLESKQQTVSRIKKVVMAPLTFGSFLAVIGLAFLVNSIEFLCSAAIPAVYTHILSLRALTWSSTTSTSCSTTSSSCSTTW